jgi:hypothetical protein
MANIALSTRATTNRAIDVVKKPAHNDQATYPAAEAITAGAGIRLDTTTGRWTNGNGTTAPEARVTHIATRTVSGGEALTGVRRCTIDGLVLDALAYDAPVYVSDTDGRLADATGTVTALVGRVVPGFAVTLGTAADKLLDVQL